MLAGRASFELDGEAVDARVGTFVFAPPGVKRTAFAQEPGTTIIAIGGAPGAASDTLGWELWALLNPLYENGAYAEAAERGRQLVAEHPDHPVLVYNLACCESLAGESAAAVEHLRRAIELSERFRESAGEDSDFDPIREEPKFQKLVGDSAFAGSPPGAAGAASGPTTRRAPLRHPNVKKRCASLTTACVLGS